MKNEKHPRQLCHANAFAVLAFLTCGSLGCGGNTIQAPPINPRSAAAKAFELYDTDGDGKLGKEELAICPGLRSALKRYDTDGDSQISQEELVVKLEKLISSGAGLVEVRCHLILDGRPLRDAQVRYVPEAFLDDVLFTATGTSDIHGAARMIVPDELLSEDQRGLGLMPFGIYRVEIIAPDTKLPTKYSGEVSPLGHDVDPTARVGGMAKEFHLSSRKK